MINQLESINPFYLAFRELKTRNLTEEEISTQLFHIKKFIFKIDKPLDQVTEGDLKEYLEKETSNKAGAYPKIISNSLSFFFNEILKLRLKSGEDEPIKMSVILSQEDYVN